MSAAASKQGKIALVLGRTNQNAISVNRIAGLYRQILEDPRYYCDSVSFISSSCGGLTPQSDDSDHPRRVKTDKAGFVHDGGWCRPSSSQTPANHSQPNQPASYEEDNVGSR